VSTFKIDAFASYYENVLCFSSMQKTSGETPLDDMIHASHVDSKEDNIFDEGDESHVDEDEEIDMPPGRKEIDMPPGSKEEFRNKLSRKAALCIRYPWFWVELQIKKAVGLVTRAFFRWVDGKSIHLACGLVSEIQTSYDCFNDRLYVNEHIIKPQKSLISEACIEEEVVYNKAAAYASLVSANILNRFEDFELPPYGIGLVLAPYTPAAPFSFEAYSGKRARRRNVKREHHNFKNPLDKQTIWPDEVEAKRRILLMCEKYDAANDPNSSSSTTPKHPRWTAMLTRRYLDKNTKLGAKMREWCQSREMLKSVTYIELFQDLRERFHTIREAADPVEGVHAKIQQICHSSPKINMDLLAARYILDHPSSMSSEFRIWFVEKMRREEQGKEWVAWLTENIMITRQQHRFWNERPCSDGHLSKGSKDVYTHVSNMHVELLK
jgi:hypothetical protein